MRGLSGRDVRMSAARESWLSSFHDVPTFIHLRNPMAESDSKVKISGNSSYSWGNASPSPRVPNVVDRLPCDYQTKRLVLQPWCVSA